MAPRASAEKEDVLIEMEFPFPKPISHGSGPKSPRQVMSPRSLSFVMAAAKHETRGRMGAQLIVLKVVCVSLFMVAGVMVGVSYSGLDANRGFSLAAASMPVPMSLSEFASWTSSMMTGECPAPADVQSEEGVIRRHLPVPKSYSRAECTCTPVHNFVILSMQRSGSGWFETLLNNHPNISSHGEVFSKHHRRNNFSTIVRTLETVYNLDFVSSAAKNECTSAVGLKWMLNQGVMEYSAELSALFRQRSVSIVLLLRRNVFKRLISILANAHDARALLNGVHKSHTHSEEEAAKLAEFKPTIDVEHLLSNLERVQQMAADAMEAFAGLRVLLVHYEDVIQQPQVEVSKVLRFLDVPERELNSNQKKIHTRPLSETISNFAEVQEVLQGSKFESFLADEIHG